MAGARAIRRERPMVQVRVAGVALDASGQHVLLLKPIDELPGDGMLLPIWIGGLEATSILVAVEQAPVPRPLAHDLMRSLLETLGAEVHARRGHPHRRRHVLRRDHPVDRSRGDASSTARPSDAVALASRVGAEIWVADAVMDDAGVPGQMTEPDSRRAPGRVQEVPRRRRARGLRGLRRSDSWRHHWLRVGIIVVDGELGRRKRNDGVVMPFRNQDHP